ncbi:tetratricopeptide repeat protein [Flavobacterium sp. 17A]|uniref:Tetratricopeptide repeat protein n=1 Tax=Flavobacterium potami TaxID=2872310 RepID=A0A9X1KNS4_9FLAO|nr:tetratricopeptide repeat protein [Flavobacterium potami]MBZ4034253.1 tetratricopeptide repeat protein [Flavobacterium potami]
MHFKTTLLLFTFFLSSFLGYSQKSFDTIYEQTYHLLGSDPKKALHNTDQLYAISKNNLERLNSSMLRAHILYQYGVHNEAISSLKKADSLATIDKNYHAQAKIYGFLASIYRENETYNLGRTYLDKAVSISKKIKDKNEMYRFQGNLSQELACYELHDSNYEKAIAHLKKGNEFFEKASTTTDKNYQIAINQEIIARNYLEMKKPDSALFYYEKAEKNIKRALAHDSPVLGFVYNGLGNVYTFTKDYKKALLNYTKAEEIGNKSDYSALKQEVNSSLMEFYKKNDSKKYILYNEKNLKLTKAENANKKVIADELIKSLQESKLQNQSQYRKSKLAIICICLFTILITIAAYIYKRKQDNKKIRAYINPVKAVLHVNTDIPKKESGKEYISEATEKGILQSLKEFEKSKSFLNKTLSLNSVAAELNINHRYLSHVISKQKSKDFAGYINELRINYIIDCLKNDATYLKYKISYLADQSGFASHTRFTVTFKKVTGVSPRTFINYLQTNKGE